MLGLLTFVIKCNNDVFYNHSFTRYIVKIVFYTVAFTMGQNGWVQLQDDPTYAISGVAQFYNGYIVVHDNKMKDQPRVSFINKKQ